MEKAIQINCFFIIIFLYCIHETKGDLCNSNFSEKRQGIGYSSGWIQNEKTNFYRENAQKLESARSLYGPFRNHPQDFFERITHFHWVIGSKKLRFYVFLREKHVFLKISVEYVRLRQKLFSKFLNLDLLILFCENFKKLVLKRGRGEYNTKK